jgi:hypothetical protein
MNVKPMATLLRYSSLLAIRVEAEENYKPANVTLAIFFLFFLSFPEHERFEAPSLTLAFYPRGHPQTATNGFRILKHDGIHFDMPASQIESFTSPELFQASEYTG